MRKTLILVAVATVLALPIKADAALQCVTYAREVTGLNLKGDAWKWWDAAHGVYDRGRSPREGAVLVFNRQGRMFHGHVAVVRKVISSRELLIDHANWAPARTAGRGKVTEAVPVIDVSPKNDWSQVRVWYAPAASYGDRAYKTQGFIYNPNKASGKVERASLRGGAEAAAKAQTAQIPEAQIPAAQIPAAMAAPVPAPIPSEPAVKAAVKVEPVVEAPVPAQPEIAAPAQPAEPGPAQPPAALEASGQPSPDPHAWAEQA